MSWEAVIGLEVHVQLATQSKIFSGASTHFGAEPNRQAALLDLGMPGTLPVLNEGVLDMAIRFGLAVNAEIDRHSVFARKNYFYPDLPKGYQISQFDRPIVGRGELEIDTGEARRTVGITRAHLEEDAGKSLHEDFHGMTGVDLNRAGTPLLEIVSEPDLRSAAEAVAYLKKLHSLVRYLEISDGNMAEGSMRCDANVSVRPSGSTEFGTRCEIKNVNSFRFVEKAINHEIRRQIDLIEDGGTVVQETRLYDADRDETRSMRGKEEANDYRYFPCPDLLPVEVEEQRIERIRAAMPELPAAKRERFTSEYGLNDYDAGQLVTERALADYFEATVSAAGGEAKLCANWVLSELLGMLNREDRDIRDCPLPAAHLGGIVARVRDGTISSKIAKQVFEACWRGEGDPDTVIREQGLEQVSDSGELERLVEQVLSENTEQADAYRAAEAKKRKKMFGFFVGQVMKLSQGKANPQEVNRLLQERLED